MTEVTTFAPRRVIILEGILLLTDSRLRELMDASIFWIPRSTSVCCAVWCAMCRSAVVPWTPCSSGIRRLCVPCSCSSSTRPKRYADVIVPRGGKNRIAIDMLKARIRHMLIG